MMHNVQSGTLTCSVNSAEFWLCQSSLHWFIVQYMVRSGKTYHRMAIPRWSDNDKQPEITE